MLPATTVLARRRAGARGLAGRGRLAPTAGDPGRFDSRHAHCDVLVVGAGESGRRAAAAPRSPTREDRVLLVDADPAGDRRRGPCRHDGARHLRPRLRDRRRAPPDADDRGPAVAHPRRRIVARDRRHRAPDRVRRQRPARDHARRRRGDLHRALRRPAGRRAVIFTNNDTTDAVAAALAAAGVEIVATVDARARRRRRRARAATTPGACAPSDRAGRRRGGDRRGRPAARVRRLEPERGAVDPGPRHAPLRRARSRRSCRTGPARTAGSRPSGRRPATIEGLGESRRPGSCRRPARRPTTPGRPTTSTSGATRRWRDLRRALGAGLDSIEHVKRYTTIGTGIDQGRTGGVVATAIAAAILGQEVGAVGVPTFRPPTVPVSFAQLAGRDRGAALPIRSGPRRSSRGTSRRRRVRGRRPVEAAALLPARRRGDGRGGPARVRGRADGRRP